MIRIAAVLVLLLTLSAPGAGAQRRQLSLELHPIHATLGVGWATAPERTIGFEAGFGFAQLDRTLVPSEETLLDFLHLGLFLRTQPTRMLSLDARVQSGLAELRGCSGCFPGVLTALSGGLFLGGRNVKLGSRLSAGVIKEAGVPSTFVLNLRPVAVLLTHRW
jgi:hypothetical protein